MSGRVRKKPRVQSWGKLCSICSENCMLSSLQCNACKKWVHASCNGLTNDDLKYISGNYPYTCSKCVLEADGGVYNYHSAVLRLTEAAETSINHLTAMVHREKTLLSGTPGHTTAQSFDRSNLRVDFNSLMYLESSDVDVQLQPILTTGNGNCLFNALSTALCGVENLAEEIKVRSCIQMVDHKQHYTTQTYVKDFILCSPSFDEACMMCAKVGGYSSAWTIQAAADVLGLEIRAVYPKVNGTRDHVAELLTRSHKPCQEQTQPESSHLNVMWTRMGMPCGSKIWIPNHFVPLVSVSDRHISTINLPDLQPGIYTSTHTSKLKLKLTKTKATAPCKKKPLTSTPKKAPVFEMSDMSVNSDDLNHPYGQKNSQTPVQQNNYAVDSSAQSNDSMEQSFIQNDIDSMTSVCLDSASFSKHIYSSHVEIGDISIHSHPVTESADSASVSAHIYSSHVEIGDISIHSNPDTESASIDKMAPNMHPLPDDKFLTVGDLLNIVNSEMPPIKSIPMGQKENIFVVLDSEENISRKFSGKPSNHHDMTTVVLGTAKKRGHVKQTFFLKLVKLALLK